MFVIYQASIMFYLSDYATLTFTGRDTQRFLQGQVTVDLMKLSPHTALFAAHCNAQGRIIANFILCFEDPTCCRLLVPKVTADILQASLAKYAVFSNTQCTRESLSIIAMQYPSSLIPSEGIPSYTLDYPKLRLIIGSESSLSILNWSQCLFEHGIAIIDEHTTGLYTPHAIGFQNIGGVDFKKGCYTGQEIIARMHFLGKIKEGLYQAHCHTQIPSRTGLRIHTSTPVGSLLSILPSQTGGSDLLINLRHQAVDEPLTIIDEIQSITIDSVTAIHSSD
jgi:tRNA-modifying protein YgfZ